MVSKKDSERIHEMSNKDLLEEFSTSKLAVNVAFGQGRAMKSEILSRMQKPVKGISIGDLECVSSISKKVEVVVRREMNSVSIIPPDDCYITTEWSPVHNKLIAIVSKIPVRL